MERARGGVPSVGVVKRWVLRGLRRRLVGVGIIGPGLFGAPAFILPLAALLLSSRCWRGLRIMPLKRCAGSSVVRPSLPPVGRAHFVRHVTIPSRARPTGFSDSALFVIDRSKQPGSGNPKPGRYHYRHELPRSLIPRSSSNRLSAKFALMEFSEIRLR